MQITDPLTNPQLIIEKVNSEILQKITAGSMLRATITEIQKNGLIELQLAGQTILAKSELSVTRGETLLINVIKAGKSPELAVVKEPTVQSLTASALRALMPKQASVQQLINTLRVLTGNPVNLLPVASQNSPQIASSPIPQTANLNPSPTLATSQGTIPLLQWSGMSRQSTQLLAQILNQGLPSSGEKAPSMMPVEKLSLEQGAAIKTLATALATAAKGEVATAPMQTISSSTPTSSDKPMEALLATISAKLKVDTQSLQPAQLLGKGLPPPSKAIYTLAAAMIAASKGGSRPSIAGLDKQLAMQISAILNHAGSDQTPITPERLKQALNQSGLLLESQLAQGQTINVDLKSSLLRLLFLLKPLAPPPQPGQPVDSASTQANQPGNPPGAGGSLLARLVAELLTQADGALARIQLNQFASLPQEDSVRQVWQFELPISHSDGTENIGIQIQREGAEGNNDDAAAWSVKLQFNIEPAGPINAHLILVGKEISSHFLAARPSSAETIERLLPKLTEAFLLAGLEIGKLTARQGDATNAPPDYQPGFPILDERA